MATLGRTRLVCWLERIVLLLAVGYFCVHALPRAWRTLNTDFPNYYLGARLVHEGYDTSRMYEWRWIQREKDHRAIDIPIVGEIPFTPFSMLAAWPFAVFPALTAKHIWIAFNLVLLLPLCWLLRAMTGLTYQRIALVFALSFPLQRNFEFGQFYLVLLFIIAAACWLYLRKQYAASGALVAFAAACKIFPVLLLVFFVRRRNWRALASALATGLVFAIISVAAFGWNAHRVFLHQVLPWALRGEALSPYVTSAASISSVLHFLLLSEPTWNAHPWHSSPLLYAVLQPTLPMLLLAPAILLIRRNDSTPERMVLEWSALLTASLAISTLPASYHCVLIAFPVCVLGAELLKRERYGWLAALAVAYLGIGFPMPNESHAGLAALLYVPRLPLMVAVLVGHYVLLLNARSEQRARWEWSGYAWLVLIVLATVLSVRSTLHQQEAARSEYAYRVPDQDRGLSNGAPLILGRDSEQMHSIGIVGQIGYRLATTGAAASMDSSGDDDLSFAASSSRLLVEKAHSGRSDIVDLLSGTPIVEGGQEPRLSIDGHDLAFVRADHGRGQLFVREAFESKDARDVALTPAAINIYDVAFLSPNTYAFAGVEAGRAPQIYLTDANHANAPLTLGEARYPALSPDGRWMAYSALDHGVWNLCVRDQATGATRRVGDVPCNQIEPSWESDSKTLIYATDCGRSLWLTAIARRRVVP
ncbi:MAG TPA: glycosyltransferase 87 family protein [Terracidiphilus sp.]|nr:glycosyltransferase 87 family protein [Terracidiphilus sp.]